VPIVARIPTVPAARRNAILASPVDRAGHAEWLAEMPFLEAVEVASAPSGDGPPSEVLRVGAWNAQRGRRPDAAARMLAAAEAPVWLLSELDVGMARTGQRHTVAELADRLGCGYAYAVEFLELGLGDAEERAAREGSENEVGYHGGAIVSRLPLLRPEVIRLEREGRWFDGTRGERRVGGRIAVIASVGLGSAEVVLASAHLESHGGPEERAAQMQVLLEAVEARDPRGPAIIGGDLNTHTLGLLELEDRAALAQALARDPGRFLGPVPHEALFEVARASGFEWEPCNRMGEPTHRSDRDRTRLKLDWLLVRGLAARSPAIIPALDPAGEALSDHEAIAATFAL
jgi:endonuclease/exonuclease/phosphatase family metal-dependent hydrolase